MVSAATMPMDSAAWGQHQLRRYVADGVDVRDVGVAPAVHVDGAPVGELYAGVLQPVARDARCEPDRLQHPVRLEYPLLSLAGHRYPYLVATVVNGLDGGGGVRGDAEAPEPAGQFGGHLLVLHRHHAVQELDDGHVHAVAAHHVAELDADGARTGDDDAGRQFGRQDLLLVRDTRSDRLVPGINRGGCPDRDDAVGERDGLAAPGTQLQAQRGRVGEDAPRVELRDGVLLHQVVDAP